MSDLISAAKNQIKSFEKVSLKIANQMITLIEQQQARIAELEQRNNELAATVDKLREALGHILNPIPKMQNDAKRAGADLNGLMAQQLADDCQYLREIARMALDTTHQQNLNAVKREVAREAYYEGLLAAVDVETPDDYMYEAITYANTKYPSDKE